MSDAESMVGRRGTALRWPLTTRPGRRVWSRTPGHTGRTEMCADHHVV